MKRRNTKKDVKKRFRGLPSFGLCLLLVIVLVIGELFGAASLRVLATDEEVEEAKERVAEAEEKAQDLEEAKARFAGYLEELNGQLDGLTTEDRKSVV